MRAVCAIATLGAALLVPAGRAAAQEPGWLPPLDVGPGYLNSHPQAVPDGAGGTLVARQERSGHNSTYVVHVQDFPDGGLPGPDQVLDGRAFFGPSLASNRRGDAIVAWDEHGQDCCDTLSVASRGAAGKAFGDTEAVSYGTGAVGEVHAAIDSAGDAVIAYARHERDNTQRIWAVFRSAGGTYSPPLPVSEVEQGTFSSFTAALDDDGEAIIAWQAPPPSTWCDNSTCGSANPPQVVSVATGTAGGFSPPTVVSDPAVASYRPRLAIDPAGDAVLAWYGRADDPDGARPVSVMAVTRRAGEPFGAAHLLGAGESSGPWTDGGLADDGHGLVAYLDDRSRLVAVTVDARTGDLGSPAALADSVAFARVAVAPGGTALVAWETPISQPAVLLGSATYVRWGGVDGSFAPARTLTCPPPGYGLIDVDLADATHAGALLLGFGATASDDDDRVALARTAPVLPPSAAPCPVDLPGDIDEMGGVTPPVPVPVTSSPAATQAVPGPSGAVAADPPPLIRTTVIDSRARTTTTTSRSRSRSRSRQRRARLSGQVLLCGGPAPGRCRRRRSPVAVTVVGTHGRRVATQRTMRGRFSFSLRPGRYTLRVDRLRRPAVLRAGDTRFVSLVEPVP